MTVLTKPLGHDCTYPVTEHSISAADARWHCHVDDCTCSRPWLIPDRHRSGAMAPVDEQLCHDVDVVSEMRFSGIDAKQHYRGNEQVRRPPAAAEHHSAAEGDE